MIYIGSPTTSKIAETAHKQTFYKFQKLKIEQLGKIQMVRKYQNSKVCETDPNMREESFSRPVGRDRIH